MDVLALVLDVNVVLAGRHRHEGAYQETALVLLLDYIRLARTVDLDVEVLCCTDTSYIACAVLRRVCCLFNIGKMQLEASPSSDTPAEKSSATLTYRISITDADRYNVVGHYLITLIYITQYRFHINTAVRG